MKVGDKFHKITTGYCTPSERTDYEIIEIYYNSKGEGVSVELEADGKYLSRMSYTEVQKALGE